jgi:predicted transcriptional regulator
MLKVSVTQQVFAFVTLNPHCTTQQIAKHISRTVQHTSKVLYGMRMRNMLNAHGTGGRTGYSYTVTNKAVKFNTGATVVAKRTAQAQRNATLTMQAEQAIAMLQVLVKKLKVA